MTLAFTIIVSQSSSLSQRERRKEGRAIDCNELKEDTGFASMKMKYQCMNISIAKAQFSCQVVFSGTAPNCQSGRRKMAAVAFSVISK